MVRKPLLKFEENGNHFEVQRNDCKCSKNTESWCNPIRGGFTGRMEAVPQLRRRSQFGWLGLFLFLLALVSSLYLVWKWHELQELDKTHEGRIYNRQLKLVSLLNRHGDRAPSDELPDVDRHKQVLNFFWPNGLHNLTDLGKMRSYKIGMTLRYMYDDYLGYDSRKVLAFSSEKLRCIETLQNTLKGLYEMEGPRSRGLEIIAHWRSSNCTQCFPGGSGSPEEWKLIHLDTQSIPTLTERMVEQCRYRKENPPPLDEDLLLHPQVRALPGIMRLTQVLKQRYGMSVFHGGTATALYSTISSELNLARTRQSIQYTDHYSDWLGEVVTSLDGGFNITLYDVFEQAAVFKYRDQTLDVAAWLEIGPIVTSLIDAQLVALGQNVSFSNERLAKDYQGRRMILYSSHDSILQRILQNLDLINFDNDLSFEQRFLNWKLRGGDQFDKFMSGLSMSAYGLSIKFELWEAKRASGGSLVFVQVSLYNQEESRFGDIIYKPLKLGDACIRLFKAKYPTANESELDRFFDHFHFIDWQIGCPFELFRNITAQLMVEEDKFNELC